ncbi:MAG: TetR/AcrR family transcriptional regulator [Candidatus Geothermincolia bacterium]
MARSRERGSKVRREELLSVAARLFCENGYLSTTMDDIAGELGVTKPALYYYVRTKHELLYEICESAIDRLLAGVREIDSSTGTAALELKALVRWHVSMFSVNGDIINVYLADEGALEPEQREHIRSLSREYESIYRRIVKQAIDEGEFRDVNVPMTVRAIAGMCNWLASWYRTDGQMSAVEIADIFLDIIMHGCVADGGAKRGG